MLVFLRVDNASVSKFASNRHRPVCGMFPNGSILVGSRSDLSSAFKRLFGEHVSLVDDAKARLNNRIVDGAREALVAQLAEQNGPPLDTGSHDDDDDDDELTARGFMTRPKNRGISRPSAEQVTDMQRDGVRPSVHNADFRRQIILG